MAHSDYPASDGRAPQGVPNISSVKDDMVAIFGPDQRADAPSPLARVVPAKPKGNRAPIYAALSVCGVATMLVAGVVGGQNVVNGAPMPSKSARMMHATSRDAVAPSKPPVLASLSSPRALAGAELTAGSPALSTAPAPAPAPSVVSPPTRSNRATPEALPVEAPVPRRASVRDANVRDGRDDRTAAVISVAVARRAPTAAVDDRRSQPALAVAPQPECSTISECLESRLRAGERGVARAYDTAMTAGVRARTLREYRAEWIRARGLAMRKPQEAIRIYGMIGSDLRLLAADPTLD